MMSEKQPLYQAMIAATCQTLENMLFTEAMEHYDQEVKPDAAETVWTSLLINNPVQGEIRLAMPLTLLKKFSGDSFGIDEAELSEAQMNDILNEMVNTIAGLFMTKLLPDDQQYQLGLPELGNGELPEEEPGSIVWKLMTADEDPLFIFASGAALVALNH
jgi:CheY-specific phosphatase CheX